MAKRRENYETAKMIIDRLEEKGPATQKQLIEELGVPKNTMNNNIRNILLEKLGIVEQLDNHKYGLKWHLPEEDEVKLHYHRTKRKLRRNPTPEEMAGLIKEAPDDVRRLLFKYIQFYREPDPNEIASAASEVWNMVVLGGLCGRFKTKKIWFEMRVPKLIIEGIDQGTFDQIMKGDPSAHLDEARHYLEDFPDMRPRIVYDKDGSRVSYKVDWTDDVKNILHSSDLWCNRFEVQIPTRLDRNLYRRYKEFLDRNGDYAIARISEMAIRCVPSREAIDDLLIWVDEPDKRYHALTALGYFCKNGIEVDQLDDETRNRVVNSLLDSFFGETSDDLMYEQALEIIEMLDGRDKTAIAKSKQFIFMSLEKGLDDGRCRGLGQWLARDPIIRGKLIEGAEDVMACAEDDRVAKLCRSFIKDVSREQNLTLTGHCSL